MTNSSHLKLHLYHNQAERRNFVKNEHEHHNKIHHVIVNGEQKEVSKSSLTYQEVCELAFPEGPLGGNIVYTVDFSYPDGTEGSMVKHELVEVKDGIIFHVGNTDKS